MKTTFLIYSYKIIYFLNVAINKATYDTIKSELIFEGSEVETISICDFEDYERNKRLAFKNTSLKKIPEGILVMKHLISVTFINNPKLTDFSNLQYCSTLNSVKIQGSNFNEDVSFLNGLKHLQTLDLSKNNLTKFPTSLTSLTSLYTLDLSSNKLSTLPDSIGELAFLIKLDLSSNFFCTINDHVIMLQNIFCLDLHNNLLKEIPSAIAFLGSLHSLDLSNNSIEIMTFDQVKINRFTQSIPIEENGFDNDFVDAYYRCLSTFVYQSNNFNKPVYSKQNCASVVQYKLSLSNFELFDLEFLTILLLNNNKIKEIPSKISACNSLTEFNISHNQVKSIPRNIVQVKTLTTANFSNNEITQVPKNIYQFFSNKNLDLQHNFISSLEEHKKIVKFSVPKYSKNIAFGHQFTKCISTDQFYKEMNSLKTHWNINKLKLLQACPNIMHLSENISDENLIRMWEEVIKYFFNYGTENRTGKLFYIKNNEEHVLSENNDLRVLCSQKIEDVTNNDLETLVDIVNNIGFIKNIKKNYVAGSNKTITLVNTYIDKVIAGSYNNSDYDMNFLYNAEKCHLKYIFYHFLTSIVTQINDQSKINMLSRELANLCTESLLGTQCERVTGVVSYFAKSYYPSSGNDEKDIESVITQSIAFYKIQCFVKMSLEQFKKDCGMMYVIRQAFEEELGIYNYFYPNYLSSDQIILETQKGSVLYEFFKLFTIESSIDKIMIIINSDMHRVNEAVEILKGIKEKEIQKPYFTTHLPDENTLYAQVIDEYFNIVVANNIDKLEITEIGVKKLLIKMGFIRSIIKIK